MGKGSLPPVFPKEVADQTQFDTRTRAYISPVRVMWTENPDLISGSENLLLQGNGQATTANTPKCVFSSRDYRRPSILLDFGREIHGGLQFVTCIRSSTKPVKVRVRLGESVGEAMCNITPENGATNDHAMRDYTIELPWLGVCEVGNSGFRFVRIDMLEDDVELPIKEIRASLLYRDIPYLGSFHSNDPRIDSIWLTGAYTLHLNLQEYLVEAPKRDRLVWLGDLHPEVRTALAVFGDNEALSRGLDFARDETPLPGWMNGMCSYSLWWVLIHRDYFQYRGDMNYLKEQQSYMTDLLKLLMPKVDAEGREHLDGGGRFLDWPTSENKKAVDAGLHALMLMVFNAGAEMMTALGDQDMAAQCTATADRMRKVTPDYTTSKQSAALISLAGIVPAEKANEVLKADGAHGFSTFYGYYMLQAQMKAGDYAGAIQNMKSFWGGMLDLGATTFWEDFNLDWMKNAARIDELTPAGKVDVHRSYGDYCYKGYRHSLAHGWASGPTAFLTEYVLGVSPAAPGYKVAKVEPHLGDLQWVEGTVPTPYGIIKVRHDKQADGTVKSKIEAPKGVKIIR
ncbi:MAG: alpha-L-rhamnosidase C-terminal domain-containing protein [Alistipes sp.]|nr:alpha-L-rhamnosidase C-terminal domain-containing protein [Alistipes sp.]